MNRDLALLLLAVVTIAEAVIALWHTLPGRKSVLI